MRAWPDFTRMSLPLRSIVLTWPRTSSTLIGPCSAMASPSIVPTASPVGLSGEAASRALPSVLAASVPFVAAESALARSVFAALEFALSAATEFIFAAENAATASKLAARKIARGRSAIFRFASLDLRSNCNGTPVLEDVSTTMFKTRSSTSRLSLEFDVPMRSVKNGHGAVRVGRRSLYYTPSLMPQSADQQPRDPAVPAEKTGPRRARRPPLVRMRRTR